MGKIAVLGMGESLKLFTPKDFDLTIGCNDIWRWVKTDVVVCLDHTRAFRPERLKAINKCTPKAFYSQIVNWDWKKGFHKIDFVSNYPDSVCDIHLAKYQKSFCSPFVAVQVAWRDYAAKEIHLFGVDMTNHPHLTGRLPGRIIGHFRLLKKELAKEGCQLIIHGNGILSGI